MGSHGGSGYGTEGRLNTLFASNLKELAEIFPVKNGEFGRPGKNKPVRIIEAADPAKAAELFWNKLSQGGTISTTQNGHLKAVFGTGSFAVFRPKTSTPGSPGINIGNKGPKNGFAPGHRIHFVQSKG